MSRFVGALPAVTSSIGLTLSGIEPLPETVEDDAMIVLSGDTEVILGADRHPGIEAPRGISWWSTGCEPRCAPASGSCASARVPCWRRAPACWMGRACTTHFTDCALLAQTAPTTRVLDNRLYVNRERYTSAGIAAGIDLMLHIVGQLTSPATAAAVARYLVLYLRRAGTNPQLSPWLEGRNHIHPAVHRLQTR